MMLGGQHAADFPDNTGPRLADCPRALKICTIVGAVFLVAIGIVRPLNAYDSWMYHLPFSSYIWEIGGGSATFHLNQLLYDRWLGFPKLWEFVQGFFWWATGSINAVIIPQMVLCAVYIYYCGKFFRIPFSYIILAFCSCPMLLVHFESTYIDLPTGMAIALAFFLLTDLVARSGDEGPWWSGRHGLSVVALFAIAGNTKFQGVLSGFAVSAIIAVEAIAVRRAALRRRGAVLALLVAANLASGATAIENLIQYHNPMYPFEVRAFGKTVFDGPEHLEGSAEYPSYLLTSSTEVSLPEPINFLLSASELDWVMRGVAPWYNLDSVTGRTPRRGPPSRTGGWGFMFVAINAWLLCVQVLCCRRRSGYKYNIMPINVCLITVATALLPRSHELRYWLQLPLIWIPVNLSFLYGLDFGRRLLPHMLSLMVLTSIAVTVLTPKPSVLDFHLDTESSRRQAIPPAVLKALAETGKYCDPSNDFLFRYSTAATGVKGLISENAEDCR